MNIEQFRDYCMSLGVVTEEFPFDECTLVFKIYGKIFALTTLDQLPIRVNLKCKPELALELRDHYPFVLPGFHMNKKHWNTVMINEASEELMRQWIEHSFEEVVRKVPKSKRI